MQQEAQLLSDQRNKVSRNLMVEMLQNSEENKRLGLGPILCLKEAL